MAYNRVFGGGGAFGDMRMVAVSEDRRYQKKGCKSPTYSRRAHHLAFFAECFAEENIRRGETPMRPRLLTNLVGNGNKKSAQSVLAAVVSSWIHHAIDLCNGDQRNHPS
jgi:hypothetical protein